MLLRLTAHQSVWKSCRHPRRLGWLELITLVFPNDNLPMSSLSNANLTANENTKGWRVHFLSISNELTVLPTLSKNWHVGRKLAKWNIVFKKGMITKKMLKAFKILYVDKFCFGQSWQNCFKTLWCSQKPQKLNKTNKYGITWMISDHETNYHLSWKKSW